MTLTMQSNTDLHGLMHINQVEHGHIYILRNPAFPDDLLKIGKTRGSVDERARRLFLVSPAFRKISSWLTAVRSGISPKQRI